MKGFLFFLYGVVSYVIFFVTFLYIIAFLGPFEMPEVMGITLVPKTVDSGVEGPLGAALVINIGLILLFGGTAQRDGATGIQGTVDPVRSGAHRAQ